MAYITFKSAEKGSNFTLKVGQSTSFTNFYVLEGSVPPVGSRLTSIEINFSRVTTYSSRTLECPFGKLNYSSGLDGSALAGLMYDISSTALKFTGGSITFSVTGASSAGDTISFRGGCTCSIRFRYQTTNASTGDLDKFSVPHGGSITLNINSSSDLFTHSVVWTASGDGNIQRDNVGSAYSSTIEIPRTWAVGQGVATLYTYYAGEQVGEPQSYTFAITVDPKTIEPDAGQLTTQIVQSPYIPSFWGDVYVQGYSKCKLALPNATPGEGLQFQSVDFAVGSQSSSSFDTMEYTTPYGIPDYGVVTCKATVTNTNGIKASAVSQTINVYEYTTPDINTLSAFRCNSSGVPTDKGQYIAVRVICSCASVGGWNGFEVLQAQYSERGSSTWSTPVSVINNGTKVISGALALGKQYVVRLTVADSIQKLQGTATTATVVALTTSHVIFCADGGINVCFGCEDTQTQNAVVISKDWKLYHGDVELSGVTSIERGGTGATTVEGARDALGLGDTDGPVPIANGGTGAASAAQARENLGLGNTDGPVPIANGGTGANNAASARANLGITVENLGAAAYNHGHWGESILWGTLAMERLPFKIERGTTSIDGTRWSTVYFNGHFGDVPTIIVSYANDAASSGIAPLKTRSESQAGFEVCMAGQSGQGWRNVNWIAIGPNVVPQVLALDTEQT